eukprot:6209705-Pleurochrysis_carterae.AAC.4
MGSYSARSACMRDELMILNVEESSRTALNVLGTQKYMRVNIVRTQILSPDSARRTYCRYLGVRAQVQYILHLPYYLYSMLGS